MGHLKVLPLQGFKSLRALNAFHTILLGLKMLPMHKDKPYDKFYEEFGEYAESEQEKMVRQAILFVELAPEELEAVLSFCADTNGIPYKKENMGNLKPDQLFECVVAVCMEISRIKIDMVSESEKKNSLTSA